MTSPSDQEIIEAVARELAAEDMAPLYEMHFRQARRVIPIIAQREREKALEEAAKVAEGWLAQYAGRNPEYVSAQRWANDAVIDIAAAIRALKDTSNE